MSIRDEINRISANIALSYDAVKEKDGALPGEQNSGNLPNAIKGIPTGAFLESVRVIESPTTVKYSQGDSFNPSGLKVRAVYTNGATKDLTDYVVNTGYPNNLLYGIGMQRVQIVYTEFGTTKVAEIRVEVTPAVPTTPVSPG